MRIIDWSSDVCSSDLYPVWQVNFHLSFAQVGFITLAFQFSASLLQPVVGLFTDKRPQPFSLPMGMMFTMLGLILLSRAWSFPVVLVSAVLIGMGRSEEHTSELQSLMRISYAVFCLKKKKKANHRTSTNHDLYT